MKKIIVVALLFLSFPVYAYYDIRTRPNTLVQVNAALEKEREYWCEKRPEGILDEKNDVQNSPYMLNHVKRVRIAQLDQDLLVARAKCNEITARFQRIPLSSIRCGTGFVKFGDECISHTDNCDLQYGSNMIGSSSKIKNISECTCASGFKFSNNRCVVNDTTTLSEEQQINALIELIAQLQAQIAALGL